MKPVIGITVDWEDKPTYSSMHSWYALRCNYTSVLTDFAAIPILIPYDFTSIERYIEMIDALIIPGGDYDLDPSVYGEEKLAVTREIKNNRANFEMKLIAAALTKNMPILAICAGEQLLAVMHGGTLLQDIKTAYPGALEHEQKKLGVHMSNTSHAIKIKKDTLLYNIVQNEEMQVNSSHHQAVKTVGMEMIVSAIAEDGIVEAVEVPKYSFVLGLEWHPEYLASKEDKLIIEAFISAAKDYGRKNS